MPQPWNIRRLPGSGKGCIWNIAEENVDVKDFIKAALAVKSLRLGVLISTVKNIIVLTPPKAASLHIVSLMIRYRELEL